MTKEERIAVIEDTMDVMDNALCVLEDIANDFKDVRETKLLKQVKVLEKAIEQRLDQLDRKRDELEE